MDLYLLSAILIGLCFLGVLISIVVYSIYNGITPMPTSRKAKKWLLATLPKTLHQGKIYELGSGWGTLAFPLAARYPRLQVMAYENSLIPYWFSRGRALIHARANLFIVRDNFFSVSLEDATLVVCYLYPQGMVNLKNKLEKELKPGVWVISNTFALPGWKALKVCEVPDLYHTKIYLYKIIERVI